MASSQSSNEQVFHNQGAYGSAHSSTLKVVVRGVLQSGGPRDPGRATRRSR